MINQHTLVESIKSRLKSAYEKLKSLSAERRILILLAVTAGTALGIIFDEFIIYISIAIAVSIVVAMINNHNI